RFDRAYVQSPFCGPSRASYYTGRYCRSHGATWNGFPIRIGELSVGEHLAEVGVRTALVGKTHIIPDTDGMARLGIDPASPTGRSLAECGFEPFERDDGLHPFASVDKWPHYNDFLREQGFAGDNPWEEWANSGEGPDGEILSGWLLKYSGLQARIPAEYSETAYMTSRAMDFMAEAEAGNPDQPWLLHLSFIKPHWPYIAPAPYHNMYSAKDILPAVRSNSERQTDHALFHAYQESRICRTFAREEVRETVIPVYMGLVKQIDDELGRLFAWMDERGLMDNTMIVFCSDHGDYLGDHCMGEKDLIHEPSIRTPLIVYDPGPEADATRGSASTALVEAIDLAPTFQDFFD
ncbi:MAG: sulfatase-like hydrolase/transferase, partial [Caldilineaceae bacterium]|nr:sulfatase-like hydrolase/transferase [Caldilineaceae bacterium]